MPVITNITSQKRRSGRFSVFVDGKYSFALSDLEYSTSGLRIGQDISANDLQQYKDSAELNKVKDSVYVLLSYRPRSKKEIEDYLRRKKWNQEIIDAVVGDMAAADLINDARFARDWVEHRQALSPRSNRKLWSELMEKGIDRDIIDEVLADGVDPVETIIRIIEGKDLRRRYPEEQKLVAYLGGQGFGYSDIKSALERIED